MEERKIGKHGLTSGAIGLGCMGMSEFYGDRNDNESIKVIHEAIDKGVTLLDTADMYGTGDNERLVEKAIGDRRDRVVLATKFGIVRTEDPFARNVNGKPEYVKSACEASLKRLGVETIDLYYQHRKDPEVEIEETVGAMAELVKEGKVRYLGLSEMNGSTISRANTVHPISALQSEYSLWSRDIEGEIIDTCFKLGISLVAYSPLGRGFLTGTFSNTDQFAEDDYRRFNPRFNEDNIKENYQMVEKLKEYSSDIGVKPSQLAIAWTLAKGENIIPIPGTKRMKYLLDNIEAANIKLTSDQLEELESIIDIDKVKGLRYPEEFMRNVNL